jgi:hypothetical protein
MHACNCNRCTHCSAQSYPISETLNSPMWVGESRKSRKLQPGRPNPSPPTSSVKHPMTPLQRRWLGALRARVLDDFIVAGPQQEKNSNVAVCCLPHFRPLTPDSSPPRFASFSFTSARSQRTSSPSGAVHPPPPPTAPTQLISLVQASSTPSM